MITTHLETRMDLKRKQTEEALEIATRIDEHFRRGGAATRKLAKQYGQGLHSVVTNREFLAYTRDWERKIKEHQA
jgi:hypothetical protein